MSHTFRISVGLPRTEQVISQHATKAGKACRRSALICRAADSTFGSTGAGKSGVAVSGVQATPVVEPSASTSYTTPRPLASSQTIKDAQSMAKLFLQGELGSIFTSGRLETERYAPDFSFQDPVTKIGGIVNFENALRALRALFKINLITHSTVVTADTEITTRWTMELTPRLTQQQPLVFTGRSFYTIDVLQAGRIIAQRDVWDGVQDNSFLSVEGLAYLLSQLTNRRTTPKLDGPKYIVYKKTKDYEVRQYRSYLAAEVSMPASAKAASGDGFNSLASYIFGQNNLGAKMEMTTPVFTTAGQSGPGKMSFPVEERMGDDPERLPLPDDARIARSKEEAATVAVGTFGGWPLDYQVTDAERKLRGALLLDGLKPVEQYKLARYNDPFTPPFLRRNEVLIKLEDYQLEQPEPVS